MSTGDVHDVVMVLGTDEARGRISVGKQIDNIVEVRVDEYHFRNPDGGSTAGGPFFLWLQDTFYPEPTTNSGVRGYPLVLNSPSDTFTQYTRPRVISRRPKKVLNWLQYELRDRDGTLATFDRATIYLSFVTRPEGWDLDETMDRHFNQANLPYRNYAYTTSVPDEHTRRGTPANP